MLLWLSQTRQDRVEEFLEGAPSADVNPSGSTSEDSVVIKKARAIFPDDFINEDAISKTLGPYSSSGRRAPGVKKEAAESTSRANSSASAALGPVARKRAAIQAAAGGPIPGPTTAESSNEVSSSQNGTGISPVPSLNSSEIGEVDLDFWDLDINESSSASQSSGKEPGD